MTQQLEAVFEDGLLRPLEPLSLQEKQHVLLTITEVPGPRRVSEWMAEQECSADKAGSSAANGSPLMVARS